MQPGQQTALCIHAWIELRNCWDKNSGADPQVMLNNGVVMPRVGFGTAGLGAATEEATAWALASGYRLLDSAQVQTMQTHLPA